jgi:methylenetetrahydrofolate dehydrogenase (NADP+)/methenyltetrahydrofolate cyclohydrolase
MTATIIDGKGIANEIKDSLKIEAKNLKDQGITPGLAVVLLGSDPASQVYVRRKRKACEKVGIASFAHDLPEETTTKQLLSIVRELNVDPKVHGILVQLPLPSHIDESTIISAIDPAKDVDGFHPINAGKLLVGEQSLRPCTPSGILALIDSLNTEIRGMNAVVVGRSNIVGKPVALMLLERHATVTVCHSRTENIEDYIREADIVVAAVGRSKFVKGEWIKKGAIVIDVGINRLEDGTLIGDVDFDTAKERASAITPVPGGVGPMTIALLLKNTIRAARALENAPGIERMD